MAIRETIQIGDPRLKAENMKIENLSDSWVKDLVRDMVDTMRENGLIGLAAPQIGENYRAFVTEPRQTDARENKDSDEVRVYINPEIVSTAGEKIIIYEGCGSVLHGQLFGPVSRPKVVEIQARNLQGQIFRVKADGLLGRVILHEYDHLEGEEFTEKVTDYAKLMSRDHYKTRIRGQKWHQENSKITINELKLIHNG